MERHASWLSYTASGSAIWCGFNLNDWGMLIGIVIGLITCGINWYYKAKEDSRRDRRVYDQHED